MPAVNLNIRALSVLLAEIDSAIEDARNNITVSVAPDYPTYRHLAGKYEGLNQARELILYVDKKMS